MYSYEKMKIDNTANYGLKINSHGKPLKDFKNALLNPRIRLGALHAEISHGRIILIPRKMNHFKS